MADEDVTPGRPRWSVVQAAKRTGVARSTIQRYLAQGKMPGAYRTADGTWSIGVEDLLGAGFRVDAPTPAEVVDPGLPRGHAEAVTSRGGDPAAVEEAARRVAELTEELADARRRAEVAEAIARERADRISDLQKTVAALEAGRGAAVGEPPPVPAPDAAPAAQVRRDAAPARSRGIVGRLADRWGI